MKVISVEGIVISTTDYKENSKIINIFTKGKGIIGCISKGCKNLKSKLRLLSDKMAYANFQISYRENGLSTLIDGDIIDYFINTKSDIIKVSYLSYIIELASSVYKESNDPEVYNLMIESIKKIEEGFDAKVITNILELQYLEYLGINLNLDSCVKCGSTKVVTISLSKGGYVCALHRTNEPIIKEKVLKLLRLYNYVDISKITNLDIDIDVRDEISNIIDIYYEEYSGVYLKSKKLLKDLEK